MLHWRCCVECWHSINLIWYIVTIAPEWNCSNTPSGTAVHRFGKNVKVVHFIGAVKPWHHTFNTATGQVEPQAETIHHGGYLQAWWSIFMAKVQPKLDPGVVRTIIGLMYAIRLMYAILLCSDEMVWIWVLERGWKKPKKLTCQLVVQVHILQYFDTCSAKRATWYNYCHWYNCCQ